MIKPLRPNKIWKLKPSRPNKMRKPEPKPIPVEKKKQISGEEKKDRVLLIEEEWGGNIESEKR